jgi:hypothetical protein
MVHRLRKILGMMRPVKKTIKNKTVLEGFGSSFVQKTTVDLDSGISSSMTST